MKMLLTVTKGEQTLQKLTLDESDNAHFFIGRSSDCHITIDDHHVSRNHAQISFVNNTWRIRKITKSGEIFLNGVSIRDEQINNGDIVQIFNYYISIVFDDMKPKEDGPALIKGEEQEEGQGLEEEQEQGQEEEHEERKEGDEETQESIELTEEIGHSEEDNQVENEEFNFGDEGIIEDIQDHDESSAISASFDDMDSEDGTKIVKSFIEFELDISGEYSNFDKYYISKEEVFIGRDPSKCQISLDDPEASQIHAVIRRKGSHCELEDLKSTNGVILNGARINRAQLSHGDEFLIGSTSFRLVVKSELIKAESGGLMPIQELEEVEVEEIVEEEVEGLETKESGEEVLLGNISQNKSLFSKEALQDPAKRKKLIIYALVGVTLWIILDEGPGKKKIEPTQEAPPKSKGLVEAEKKSEDSDKKDRKGDEVQKVAQDPKRSYENLPPDIQEYIRANYELAKTEILDYGNFEQGLQYLDKINEYVDEFEQSKSLEITAKEEFKKLEEIEKERKRKQREQEKAIRVGNLLKKTNQAFDQKQLELTQALLDKIAEIDPENLDASQLKLQLDAHVREEERKALEEAQKKARRDRLVNGLRPGKNIYLQEKWYQAIIKLEEYLEIKDNDDDLVAEATKLLKESQNNLKKQVNPLLAKAQSLDEGQDLKGAYRTYKEILKIDPSSVEAVERMDDIKGRIEKQAKRIYREAIIDESLNYLKKAKEKFQEVQQISPADSPYHKRAAGKLRSYTD